MHDAEAFVFKLFEKPRQRGNRLRVNIVKKQNALAICFEPLHRRGNDLLGADAVMPIVGNRIRRENNQTARREFALHGI